MVHVVKVRFLTLCDCDVGVEVCGVDGVCNWVVMGKSVPWSTWEEPNLFTPRMGRGQWLSVNASLSVRITG